MSTVADRWSQLLERLREACSESGRDPEGVRVIAVSKVQPLTAIQEAQRAGVTDFGENRVQEAERKIPKLTPRPVWHLVGHLQTNKAQKAARLFDWVQSVDSIRIAHALGKGVEQVERDLGVLIQVNTTGEDQKSGCRPDELESVIAAVTAQPRLKLSGLMAMGPLSMAEKPTREAFDRAARLRDRWRTELPPGAMSVLSMGMTADWPWAIEHGADWIRIGTAIFGPRT